MEVRIKVRETQLPFITNKKYFLILISLTTITIRVTISIIVAMKVKTSIITSYVSLGLTNYIFYEKNVSYFLMKSNNLLSVLN